MAAPLPFTVVVTAAVFASLSKSLITVASRMLSVKTGGFDFITSKRFVTREDRDVGSGRE